MKTAFVLLALCAVAFAACPNRCSGHGTCGGSDKCTCFPNWQGSDCSERTCRFDIAWAVDHFNDAHYYAECSGKGLCDRETGECVCFEGYTGNACKRSVCPNDCSGHGKCRLVEELPLATQVSAYTEWDSDKIQACVCDGGFYGPDCSQRYCPKGDDPLTICDDAVTAGTTYQVQRLSLNFGDWNGGTARTEFQSAADLTAGGFADLVAATTTVAFRFTDNTGETWWTEAVGGLFDSTAAPAAVIALSDALQALPNFRIPAVTVSRAADRGAAGPGGLTEYLITFNAESTGSTDSTFGSGGVSGNQNLLQCDFPLGCTTRGCQPYYTQPRYLEITGDNVGIALSAESVFTAYNNDHFAGSANAGAGIAAATGSGLVGANFATMTGADSGVAVAATTTGYADAVIHVIRADGAAEDADVDLNFPSVSTEADTITVFISYLDSDNAQVNEMLVPTMRIPEIVDDLDATTATHLDIGHGLALDITDRGLVSTPGTAIIEIHVPRCTVTEEVTAHAEREDVECSGRGTCDSSTGVCSCFEGFYGDHCALQTILV